MKNNNRKNWLCSVAGVSYNNPDGSYRQEILSRIAGNHRTGDTKCIAELVLGIYEDANTHVREKAIYVHVGCECIGAIPRTEIGRFMDIINGGCTKVLASVGFYEKAGKYTCNLYEYEAPTKAQYATVVAICRNHGWQMPLYEKGEYTHFLTKYYAANKK